MVADLKKRILDSEILAGGDADSVLTFHPDKLVGSTNGRNGPYKPQQTSGPYPRSAQKVTLFHRSLQVLLTGTETTDEIYPTAIL